MISAKSLHSSVLVEVGAVDLRARPFGVYIQVFARFPAFRLFRGWQIVGEFVVGMQKVGRWGRCNRLDIKFSGGNIGFWGAFSFCVFLWIVLCRGIRG